MTQWAIAVPLTQFPLNLIQDSGSFADEEHTALLISSASAANNANKLDILHES
jgi:hypothetical protein